MLEVLRRSSLPIAELVPFATERSEGRELSFAPMLPVQVMSEDTIQGFDLALFSAGGSTSREWAPRFVAAGRRRRRQLERLAHARRRAARRQRGQPRRARRPPGDRRQPELHDDGRDAAAEGAARRVRPDVARRDLASRPPAARGRRASTSWPRRSSRSAATSTCSSTTATARRMSVESSVHADTLAYNVVPMLGTLGDEGYTDEEMKLQNESRKILYAPDLAVSPTCVRVPVMVGHSIACRAGFDQPVDVDAAMEALQRVPEPRRPGRPDPARVGGPRRGRGRPRPRRPRRPERRSTSSSSATTCSRAPRSTRSRSPSACTSATSSARGSKPRPSPGSRR